MKLTELHKHLYTYDDHRLHDMTVNGRHYKTDPAYRPTLIICMSFGKKTTPDSYNLRLAHSIKDARDLFGPVPVIAQREVHELFIQEYAELGIYGVCRRLEKDTVVGTDVRTKDAFEEARTLIEQRELDASRILYIAHPAHIFRVLAMGRKASAAGQPLEGVPFVDLAPKYNPGDGQLFTRHPRFFAYRELGARIHHKMRQWI